MKIKTGFLMVLVVVGAWLGFRAGYQRNAPASSSAQTLTDEAVPSTAPRGQNAILTQANLPAKRNDKTRDRSNKSTYENILSNHQLDKKHADFSKYFPDTVSGEALTQLGVLYIFSDTSGSEREAFEEALRAIEARPVEAIADLRDALQKLPDNYARERQLLVRLGSRLDADDAVKFEMLKNELERPMLASNNKEGMNDAFYTPAVALESLVEMTQDGAAVENVLREGLRENKSKEAQDLLISRFAVFDQGRAAQLRREFGL